MHIQGLDNLHTTNIFIKALSLLLSLSPRSGGLLVRSRVSSSRRLWRSAMDCHLHVLLILVALFGSMLAVQGKQKRFLTYVCVRITAITANEYLSNAVHVRFTYVVLFEILYAECGSSVRRSRQPRASAMGRIINGRQSPRGAWPWQVM